MENYFYDLTDSLIPDRLIGGLEDVSLHGHLLKDPDLNIAIWRQDELTENEPKPILQAITDNVMKTSIGKPIHNIYSHKFGINLKKES